MLESKKVKNTDLLIRQEKLLFLSSMTMSEISVKECVESGKMKNVDSSIEWEKLFSRSFMIVTLVDRYFFRLVLGITMRDWLE